MNQVATQQRTQMDSVGVTTGVTGSKIAPQNLGEVVKFAEVMSRADIALPKHLRGNTGACMAVALQAMEWNLSPFAVASKSYQVNGAIAYEAQLIAAVVNTRSGIKGRLKYRYEGEGNTLTCTVTGILDGEECTYTSPQMGSITTKNSPLWKSDPQQQLGYFAARSWARRHCPEVILGVYDRDEAEEFRGPDNAKNITPAFDPLSDEPIATQATSSEREGFASSFVQSETGAALQGEVIDAETNSNTDGEPPFSTSVDADPPSASEAGDSYPLDAPASQPIPKELLVHFKDYARKALVIAGNQAMASSDRLSSIAAMLDNYRYAVPADLWPQLTGMDIAFTAVVKGARTVEKARNYIARDILECSEKEIGG